MRCDVCQRQSEDPTCGPSCAALAVMGSLQAQNDARDAEVDAMHWPGMVADERAQLQWEYRKRWHEARGLEFHEAPPKTRAMRELERLDLMVSP